MDNDRSRRGEHFMSDTLYHNAMYSHILSTSSAAAPSTSPAGALDGPTALPSAFQGLSAVDDAHKRLFPFDHASLTDTQQLSEDQLRELLHQAGDEYLAAKSAKQRGGSSGADSSGGAGTFIAVFVTIFVRCLCA